MSSSLSDWLSRLRDWLRGCRHDCRRIHQDTYDDPERAKKISALAPGCGCEKCRMSNYSPGPVSDDEVLARFAFSPIHYDRKGKLRPSIFSHAETKGCSIQRDSLASDDELVLFVTGFLRGQADREWRGVLLARCHEIRALSLATPPRRAACVYDTAEHSNPSHGEIGRTEHVDDGDANELRALLWRAFGNGHPVTPEEYRAGAVLSKLGDEVRGRI